VHSRYCAARATYPDPWQSQGEFARWLLGQAREVDLILPISEAALLAAVDCRPRLASRVIAPAAESLRYTLSKREATAKALALGLPCAATAFARGELAALGAPYIVRTDNRLMPDGSYRKGRNWFVADARELKELLDQLDEKGERWMVQEHFVGAGAGAFVLRWGAQTRLDFAHERVHEVPFHGGVSSLRRSVRDPAMLAAASRLLEGIGYEGVAMVEFRRGRPDQTPYFIEINGRLWGSLALALHAGADFPAQLVDCYAEAGPGRPPPAYSLGVYCRNVYPGETDYVQSVLAADGPVRGVKPPSKVRTVLGFFALFFRPRVHYDYLWLRDPAPWLRQSVRDVAHVAGSRWTGWRRARRWRRLEQQFGRPAKAGTPDLRDALFLCYGNICRSAFAGAYWDKSRGGSLAAARSAGFHPEGGRRTPARIAALARDFGVDLSGHRSQVVDSEAITRATAIFAMDGQNLEDLLALAPEARAKTWLLGSFGGLAGIRDPYLLPQEEARASLHQIRESIDALADRAANASRAAAPACLPGNQGP
jgi:protein-tyrosine-phosphatase